MEQVNVGVVGVGHLGSYHAKQYARLKHVNFVGVCDLDKKTAQRIGKKYKVWYFADYKEFFGKVQAVSIVVPTSQHHRIAKDFLEAGINVLVEKPVTKTVEEADELIRIADEKKLVLQVGHIERFNPAIHAMEPYLSLPRFIEGQRMGPFTKKSRVKDVGVVLDLMIHDIDLILGLVRSEVTHIEAVGTSSVSEFEDMANVRLGFRNGAICDITASRITKEEVRKIRVFQENSYIALDLLHRDAYIYRKIDGNIKKEKIHIEQYDPLKQELKSFIHCVMTGGRPVVSGREGRDALAVALAILDNIKTN
ncbi:MAG: Gfo/Idh/MocA family oxidoreductase [Candidatus Omnitrophica bacterium]|nr:Gfo/Idh/MocA family oxidoreductase [Candidatus Omnitrophota bacterium]